MCLAGLVLSPLVLPHGVGGADTSQAQAEPALPWSGADRGLCQDATLREVSYQLSLAVAGRPDGAMAPDLSTLPDRSATRVTQAVAAVLSTATAELLASDDRVVARVLEAHRGQIAQLCASA